MDLKDSEDLSCSQPYQTESEEEFFRLSRNGESSDENYDIEDDLPILELAMTKAIEKVNPTLFVHLLCPDCGKTFQSPPLWQQHLHNVHFFNNIKMLPGTLEDDNFRCDKCPTEFNCLEYRKILLHCLSHMTFSSYFKCSLCDHLEKSDKEMARHIKRHMQVHMLKAKINGKVLSLKRFSLSEGIDYEKFLLYICPECQLMLRKHKEWLQHVTDNHELFAQDKLRFKTLDTDESSEIKSDAITTCELCATSLTTNNLKQCQQKHYLTHLRYRAFQCGICELPFNYANEIKMHVLLLHCKNIETYEEAILPPHLRPSSTKFNMNLKFCTGKGKRYFSYVGLNCPICGVKFDNSEMWRFHINENHDFFKAPYMALIITGSPPTTSSTTNSKKQCLKPYCVLCDRPFGNTIEYHLLRHAPFRPYSCRICMEEFHRSVYVMRHINHMHTNKDGTIDASRGKK